MKPNDNDDDETKTAAVRTREDEQSPPPYGSFENTAYVVGDSAEADGAPKFDDVFDIEARKSSYDPHVDGVTPENSTSFFGTTFHVLIIVAGPIILSIPSAFVSAGYAVGLVLVPSIVYLYAYTASMMVWSEYALCTAKRMPKLSYPDTVYHALVDGPAFCPRAAECGRRLSYVVFFLVWFGFCCYTYVIVCENLQVLVTNAFQLDVPLDVFLVALIAPLLLLGWIPKLRYLVPFSALGSLFNAVSLALIVYFVFTDSSPWNVPPAVGQLSNVPLLVGSVLFSLNMAGIMLSLKNEMSEPRKFGSCCGVLMLSFAVTSVVYTCFSAVCVLKYGHATQPSIIENLPPDSTLAQAGILLSSLALLLQYPLVLYVPFDIVWNQILKRHLNSQHPLIWEYALRTTLVLLSFAVSAAVPNVFLFLSLSGTVCTSIDSLILPALVHSAVVWRTYTSGSRTAVRVIFVKNMAIVALAVLLVITGSRDCVDQIINYYYGGGERR